MGNCGLGEHGMERTPELASFGGASQVNGVALVLPGGMVRSRGRYRKFFERARGRKLIPPGSAVVPDLARSV